MLFFIVFNLCNHFLYFTCSDTNFLSTNLFSILIFNFLLLIFLGGSQSIEVTFRPDRYRYLPYREELQIQRSSKSYESTLKINLVGRSRNFQIFVMPEKPYNELFATNLINRDENSNNNNYNDNYVDNNDDNEFNNQNNNNNDNFNNNNNNFNDNFIGKGMLLVNDILLNSTNNDVKNAHTESLKYSHTNISQIPPIKLEFPNPFGADVDPNSYTEIENLNKIRRNSIKNSKDTGGGGVSGGAGVGMGGGKDGSGNGGGNTGGNLSINDSPRQQTRRILISSILPQDNRGTSTTPGNFEILLSSAAKECGLWTVNSVIIAPVAPGKKK